MNEAGNVAAKCWQDIPNHFLHIELDEYVIMPNHIHGVIVLSDDENGKGTMLRAATNEQFAKPTSNTIPTIIRGFKSIVTKKINEFRQTPRNPVWQRNYYEHIIRDEIDLNRIRKYIVENPLKWQDDRYFK